MSPGAPGTRHHKAFIVLFLAALVCAQAAALLIVHSHQNTSDHCCLLCHIGPMPFVAASVSELPAPDLPVLGLASSAGLDQPCEVLGSARLSRGPPA